MLEQDCCMPHGAVIHEYEAVVEWQFSLEVIQDRSYTSYIYKIICVFLQKEIDSRSGDDMSMESSQWSISRRTRTGVDNIHSFLWNGIVSSRFIGYSSISQPMVHRLAVIFGSICAFLWTVIGVYNCYYFSLQLLILFPFGTKYFVIMHNF